MDWAAWGVRLLLGATAHPGGTGLTRHLLDRADLPPGALVLDLACGAGATLELLRDVGHLPIGLDVEPRAARRAARHAPVAVGDAGRLPLTGATFDAVVCECALSTFEHQDRALSEVVRVLRPGGTFAMSDVLLHRSQAPAAVVRAVDRLTTARSLAAYAEQCDAAGLDVRFAQERPREALALVRRVRRRLAAVGAREAAATARACETAVREGALGYGLLVARRR